MNSELNQDMAGGASLPGNASRYALIASIALTPLIYFQITAESHLALKEMVVCATALILLGLSVAGLSADSPPAIRFSRLDSFILLFTIFSGATIFLSLNKQESLLAWIQLPSLLVVYFYVSRNARDLKSAIPAAISVSATIVSIITLSLSVVAWSQLSQGGADAMLRLKDALVFPLGGNNFTAAYLTAALPATIGLADGSGGVRGFKNQAVFIQSAAIAACFGRIALAGLLLIFVVWAICLLIAKKPLSSWAGPGAIVLGAAISSIVFFMMVGSEPRQAVIKDLVVSPEGGADQGVDSMHMRLFWWKDTVKMIADHPEGVGFGGFSYMFPRYRTIPETFIPPQVKLTTPHNDYLHVAAETGFVGLALFAGLLVLGVAGAASGLKRKDASDREAAIAAAGIIIIMALYGIADFPFIMPATRLLFFIALGIAASFALPGAGKEIPFSDTAAGAAIVAAICGLLALDYVWARNFVSQSHVLKQINSLDKTEVSISEFKKAIALNSGAKFAHLYAGSLYDKTGDCGKSIEMFKKAIELDPNDYNIINYLGVAYAHCGHDKEAVESFEKASKIYPAFASPHLNAGIVHLSHKNNDRAAKHFRSALELNENIIEVYTQLAEVEKQAGNTRAAARLLNRALEIQPGNAAVTQQLYSLHDNMGAKTGGKAK